MKLFNRFLNFVIYLTIVVTVCESWKFKSVNISQKLQRKVFASFLSFSLLVSPPTIGNVFLTGPSLARNLPEYNGAIGNKRGTVEALVPIVKMRNQLSDANKQINDFKTLKNILNGIPNEEKAFKRIFDEFSLDVSYKQRYLDSNAFLVYYTKGFDGINRY